MIVSNLGADEYATFYAEYDHIQAELDKIKEMDKSILDRS